MGDLRTCKVCNFKRQHSYGLVVPSLEQLRKKGSEYLGISADTPVSVVLEQDGTFVEDEIYFLCLPANTKFMLLGKQEEWRPVRKIEGGTAWMTRDSMLLEVDAVDGSISQVEHWWILAQQLKQDLSSIIHMSEADLQTLVDIPCAQLASTLNFTEHKAANLQENLQRALDRKEEERQSKELLRLYIKAVEKEESQAAQASQQGAGVGDQPDGLEVDSASGFMTRTLMVLKGKTSPETRLSTEELKVVVSKGAAAMQQVLGLDGQRTADLLQACQAELSGRLQQTQAMHSLSCQSQPDIQPDNQPDILQQEEEEKQDPAAGSSADMQG